MVDRKPLVASLLRSINANIDHLYISMKVKTHQVGWAQNLTFLQISNAPVHLDLNMTVFSQQYTTVEVSNCHLHESRR